MTAAHTVLGSLAQQRRGAVRGEIVSLEKSRSLHGMNENFTAAFGARDGRAPLALGQ